MKKEAQQKEETTDTPTEVREKPFSEKCKEVNEMLERKAVNEVLERWEKLGLNEGMEKEASEKEGVYECIEHFDMEIELLRPNGSVLKCYQLADCKINKANNTVLNYNSIDSIMEGTMNISYKVCTTKTSS